MKDIILLVADKNMEFLLKGLLPRIPNIEHISNFTYDIYVHSKRDPGVFSESHDFLRQFCNSYKYCIVLFDYQGCGQEKYSREQLEETLGKRLEINGWNNNYCVIAIAPELEQWIWVNEQHIQKSINWQSDNNVYSWLHSNNYKIEDEAKPINPKEAFEKVLFLSQTPRSSSIYYEIAANASYRECKDPAFQKLIKCLKQWFSK